MTGLWISAAALSVLVLALLLAPLVRRRPAAAPGRADYDISVYRDQLREVERDLERGVLAADQAEAARTEIQRRLLAADDDGTHEAPAEEGGNRLLMAAIAVLVPAGAVALYLAFGSPGTPDRPFDEHAATAAAGEAVVARLADRLAKDPDDLEGWMLLGRSLMTLNRYDDAVGAFRQALQVGEHLPTIAAAYGVALVAAAGATVTAEARDVFLAVLQDEPDNPQARYYLGLERAQQGDDAGALKVWLDLRATSPADAPWRPTLERQIGAAAERAGIDPATLEPSPEAAAAEPREALSDDERKEMIRTMVERLAVRLEASPDDREGWLRLERSYLVLGETDKARQAAARAAALAKTAP